MNFQKKLNDTGLSRRLNPGQLLGIVARKVKIGKRQKENAITRATLSLGDGSPFTLIKTSVENFQHDSKLAPEQFYKVAFTTLLEYLDHAPACDSHEKRVEIHHHYNTTSSAVDDPTADTRMKLTALSIVRDGKMKKNPNKKNAPSETSDAVQHSADRDRETKPEPKPRTNRQRLRFSDSNLRTATSAPWKCPFDSQNCETCRTFWCRRYRCSRSDCKYEHLDGAHTVLNSVERRLVRTQHLELCAKEAEARLPPTSPTEAPDCASLKEFPQLSPPCKRRRSVSYDEVDAKRTLSD